MFVGSVVLMTPRVVGKRKEGVGSQSSLEKREEQVKASQSNPTQDQRGYQQQPNSLVLYHAHLDESGNKYISQPAPITPRQEYQFPKFQISHIDIPHPCLATYHYHALQRFPRASQPRSNIMQPFVSSIYGSQGANQSQPRKLRVTDSVARRE